MSNSETQAIYSAIKNVMQNLGAVGKDNVNASEAARYNYRSIDDVVNTISPLFAEFGIFVRIKITEKSEPREVVTAKGRKGLHVVNRYDVSFVSTEDGSSVTTEAIGEAIDYGDKAYNKAATMALKYALTQTFCIKTSEKIEDKDADQTSHVVVTARRALLKSMLDDETFNKVISKYDLENLSTASWQALLLQAQKKQQQVKPLPNPNDVINTETKT